MRGGAHEPLSDAAILAKFRANAKFGGWEAARTQSLETAIATIARGGGVDLAGARG